MAKKKVVRRRKRISAKSVGLTPAEVADLQDSSARALAAHIEEDGGAVLASYRDPFGGTPAILAALPIDRVEPTPYQRDPSQPHVKRLMVGETFNPPGNWSSYPPHKHDGRDGEPTLEEMYYFTIDPPQGFGQQILYTNEGESAAHSVKDGDAVLLPYGYHPVAASPGYRLCYLWGMAGEQRKLALHEDPAHKWVHDAKL